MNNPSREKHGKPLYRHAVALDTGDPLAPLRRDPATAGIFSDFDGTLSPIVEYPELAEPVAEFPASWPSRKVCQSRVTTGPTRPSSRR